jgi:hypothetical protein
VSDALQKLDIMRTVITPSAAALQRLYLSEAGFPETQDVLRQVKVFPDFAYGAECIRAFVHATQIPN